MCGFVMPKRWSWFGNWWCGLGVAMVYVWSDYVSRSRVSTFFLSFFYEKFVRWEFCLRKKFFEFNKFQSLLQICINQILHQWLSHFLNDIVRFSRLTVVKFSRSWVFAIYDRKFWNLQPGEIFTRVHSEIGVIDIFFMMLINLD